MDDKKIICVSGNGKLGLTEEINKVIINHDIIKVDFTDFEDYVKTGIINQIVNDPKNKQRNPKRTRDMSLDEFMSHTTKLARGGK